MSRSEAKKTFVVGPGGINCSCCRPAKCNKKDAKRFSGRYSRRLGKAVVKAEQ